MNGAVHDFQIRMGVATNSSEQSAQTIGSHGQHLGSWEPQHTVRCLMGVLSTGS